MASLRRTKEQQDSENASKREIRGKGRAFSDQEVARDVGAVAAPIFKAVGESVGG